MLEFCSLFSGSTGNCLFVQSDETKILIDAGVSGKKITEALESIDVDINSIEAILVTHEHKDHVLSLSTLSKKYNIPIYANEKTWNVLNLDKVSDENKKSFEPYQKFAIQDLEIFPFLIPHDAIQPCGFNICQGSKKFSIATDLGHIDSTIFSHLKDSSFVMLESNYDPEILKYSSYPYLLKQRIAGPNGHLSNNIAGQVVSKLFDFGLKNVMLAHLSKENNFPELAYQTVREELCSHNISEQDLEVTVANRSCPSKFIKIC